MTGPKAKGDPILISCEGSDGPGNLANGQSAMCQMCGAFFRLLDGRVVPHLRDDVLARIDRGDFG